MSTGARGRISLALAGRDASDEARDLVALAGQQTERGALVRAARRIRLQDVTLVDLAVLIERAEGATWDELAEATGQDASFLVARYGPSYDEWCAALANGGDPTDDALMLDAWLTRRRDPWDDAAVERPVSRALDVQDF